MRLNSGGPKYISKNRTQNSEMMPKNTESIEERVGRFIYTGEKRGEKRGGKGGGKGSHATGMQTPSVASRMTRGACLMLIFGRSDAYTLSHCICNADMPFVHSHKPLCFNI